MWETQPHWFDTTQGSTLWLFCSIPPHIWAPHLSDSTCYHSDLYVNHSSAELMMLCSCLTQYAILCVNEEEQDEEDQMYKRCMIAVKCFLIFAVEQGCLLFLYTARGRLRTGLGLRGRGWWLLRLEISACEMKENLYQLKAGSRLEMKFHLNSAGANNLLNRRQETSGPSAEKTEKDQSTFCKEYGVQVSKRCSSMPADYRNIRNKIYERCCRSFFSGKSQSLGFYGWPDCLVRQPESS